MMSSYIGVLLYTRFGVFFNENNIDDELGVNLVYQLYYYILA